MHEQYILQDCLENIVIELLDVDAEALSRGMSNPTLSRVCFVAVFDSLESYVDEH